MVQNDTEIVPKLTGNPSQASHAYKWKKLQKLSFIDEIEKNMLEKLPLTIAVKFLKKISVSIQNHSPNCGESRKFWKAKKQRKDSQTLRTLHQIKGLFLGKVT